MVLKMETSGEKFDAKNIGQLYAKSYSVMKMYGFLPSVSIECCKNKIDQLYASVMPGDNQWKMAGFMGVQVNAIRFFSSNLAASLLATPSSPLLDIFGHFNCWLEEHTTEATRCRYS